MKTMIFSNIENDNMTVCEKVDVKRVSAMFACIISQRYDNYNAVVDSNESNSRSFRDDYIHIYRHDTKQSVNAHNNVFQCYLKHSKECVNILCNKANFDAFNSEIEHVKQYKKSLVRYVVAYDNFIAFMREIITYDNARLTTSATKENVSEIAK